MKQRVLFLAGIFSMVLVFGLVLPGCGSEPSYSYSQPSYSEPSYSSSSSAYIPPTLDDDFPELPENFSEDDDNNYLFFRWGMSESEVMQALQKGDVIGGTVINQVNTEMMLTHEMWFGTIFGKLPYTGMAGYYKNRLSTLTLMETTQAAAGRISNLYHISEYNMFKDGIITMETYIMTSIAAKLDQEAEKISADDMRFISNAIPSYNELAALKQKKTFSGEFKRGVTEIEWRISVFIDKNGEIFIEPPIITANHGDLERARLQERIREERKDYY